MVTETLRPTILLKYEINFPAPEGRKTSGRESLSQGPAPSCDQLHIGRTFARAAPPLPMTGAPRFGAYCFLPVKVPSPAPTNSTLPLMLSPATVPV